MRKGQLYPVSFISLYLVAELRQPAYGCAADALHARQLGQHIKIRIAATEVERVLQDAIHMSLVGDG